MATKTELQEEALLLEVNIHHPAPDEDGVMKELTKAELTVAIEDARAAALAQHEADEVAKEQARQPLPPEEAPPVAAATETKSRGGGRKLPKVAPVSDPTPELLAKLGTTVTKSDRALARKHGYPIAVPGGSAFTTAVSFNCIYGGGLRPMNSVVIVDEVEAHHKAEYLTAV